MTFSLDGRTAVKRTALVVAALSFAWTAYIVVTGGFEGRVFGIAIKSREPLRALSVASVALLAYAIANGVERTCSPWAARLLRIDTRIAALALAAVTFCVGMAYATTAAIGPDPYGYVSQADLWLRGESSVAQPWARAVPWPGGESTFTPLGYTERNAIAARGGAAIVPTYSPGLPLLMAAFKRLGGQGALFAVVPLMGALLVLATYGIGARLHAPRAGLIASWLITTSPAFLFMLMLPMSDVPVSACWAAATYLALVPTSAAAAGAGLACALAILIRPNLWMLAALLAAWLVARDWAGPGSARRAAKNALAFCATTAVGPIAVAAVYSHLYGSPFLSGYGSLGAYFSWAHILPNVRRYLGWLASTETPLGLAGLAALVVPSRVLWRHIPDRRVLLLFGMLVATVWAQYLAYLVFDGWAFLRFVLPTWPFIMLGSAAVVAAATRAARPVWPRAASVPIVVAAWAVFMLGAYTLQIAHDRGVFNEWRNDRRFVDMAERVRAATGDASVVYTMFQSGSIRYYAGRETFRFDALPPDWLDRSIEWFARRGVHPYAAFADRLELDDFKRRFPGQRALTRLDDSLLFTYADEGVVYFYFYDLLPAPGRGPTFETSGDLTRLRSVPPVAAPSLRLVP